MYSSSRKGFKVCRLCEKEIPFNQFHKNKSSSDGINSYCKTCRNENLRRKRAREAELVPPSKQIPEGTKRCTKCKEIFPSTTEFFNKRSIAKDGLYPSCKLCKIKYRSENYPKLRVQQDAWIKKFPEKKRRSWQNYQKSENFRRYQSSYVKKYPNKKKQWTKNYQLRNKEKISAARKVYKTRVRKEKKLEINERLQKYYQENDVPRYLWHKTDFASEWDFQEALEHTLVNKLKIKIERWTFFEEVGLPDIYLPEFEIILELKIMGAFWSIGKLEAQVRKYITIANTIVVSLDGSTAAWKKSKLSKEVAWFNPEELFQFLYALREEKI